MKLVGITIGIRKNGFIRFREHFLSLFENTLSVYPVFIAPVYHEDFIKWALENLHGLILSGGGDIHPSVYGEPLNGSKSIDIERDRLEIELVKAFYKHKKPVLGICRGMQVMNVALGGTLFQDIRAHYFPPEEGLDRVHHTIEIIKNTKLFRIFQVDRLGVNSFHHQAVKEVGEELIINAVSSDGVIEGIEARDHPFFIGVQFHAEFLYNKEPFRKLFEEFKKNL